MSWQRTNIQAAAAHLREQIARGATDSRTKAIYEGLLEVLDPTRRAGRIQREMADSAKGAVVVHAERDRRSAERRGGHDRRRANLGSPTGIERRANSERRLKSDRRQGR